MNRPKALSTLESMLAGLIAGIISMFFRELFLRAAQGTATTVISNPIWVTQVTQATQTLPSEKLDPVHAGPEPRKLSMLQTVRFILRKGGVSAFWRGIGPSLVLVINPILQVGRRVRAIKHIDAKAR